MKKVDRKEVFRAAKFTLISISAGLIQIGSFTLLNEVAKLEYWLSYFIALVLSVLWNFTINRNYTFKSASNVPIAMLKVVAYYVVFTPLSLQLEWLLTNKWTFPGSEYVATGINMLINFVTEFLYQRFFVFGKSIDTKSKKKGSAGEIDAKPEDFPEEK